MRTHYCNQINASLIDQEITLCGWVHRRRVHSGLVFIDCRDKSGRVQVVCAPEETEPYEKSQVLRNEYVIEVTGKVRQRPDDAFNEKLSSGEVEVLAHQIIIHNDATSLPFTVDEYQPVGEDTRLKFRHIDLRRDTMFQRMLLRSKINHHVRSFLHQHGFTEVETPILTKSTPEGARDYLVASRNQQGHFYALPQSPQIFKQLLMIAGFDRYYQIARCFRDEDLRADRQPEFTQLDIEMSFMDEEAIKDLISKMIQSLFESVLNVTLPQPFAQMTYQEAMQRYGTDRPDLRIPLEIIDIDDLVKDVDFKVFSGPANDPEGRVAVLRAPQGVSHLTRKQIDDYAKFVKIYGAKGLAYIKVNDRNNGVEGLQSPILKFLNAETLELILDRTGAETGDILFFSSDSYKIASESLAALRVKLGEDLNLNEGGWRPVWIEDFPMFEKDDNGNWQALHHPFTAPKETDTEQLKANPGNSISRAYDLVLNGYEIGGGSIRIHHHDMQMAAFEILGIDADTAQEKFGHLLNALQHGCPPHGGVAFGLDRIAMLMSNAKSIRDVIAFPKTQTGSCPLTNAPSTVDAQQLQELGIKTTNLKTEKA
jgi:aspartyl-tRNA synthetase